MKTIKLEVFFKEDIVLNENEIADCFTSEGKIRFNDLRQVLKNRTDLQIHWQNLHHYKIPSQDKRD